ncbi:MAG: DUF3141 domain-containing protein, partial [Burkholderiales bacterium]|nr:DUF3141 domain-containing protein [Burkholderiales bacterium]
MEPGNKLARTAELGANVAKLYGKRVNHAVEQYRQRLEKARDGLAKELVTAAPPVDTWQDLWRYAVDSAQRGVLFVDALRQRGNQFVEHTKAGLPPVLHFDWEMVLDGRTLERPVNYALVRIVPPEGTVVDAQRRPYVIIDPRAGHGPGIGGFKDDSQVGVALRDGHPVYFVIFYPEPEPGQTLLDVTAAERRFVQRVRALHPKAPKPAIVGNCQGGWAAMMLAASHPEDTGPIVINGAPMSYWGGAWTEGPSDNPMRYAGGLLGGTWLSSLSADLGSGLFDGAYLVQNFENLNPANTYWDKYVNVFRKVDTEVPRFLEFERWWGGFYLMNREEIEWITQNLFVGNKLWKGGTAAAAGKVFDLREIRAPIVLFASMGDNITPPQQAFNWVADVYGSTDEIKARGQVIVGLLHEDAGHLGIFVSGAVAKKEHAQIVSVLKSIEALPPGLYGMQITEVPGRGGEPAYEVGFEEKRLEDVAARLNRFERKDEVAFEAVEQLSAFNQKAYELFARPWVQALTNESTAQWLRQWHPLRAERWLLSDLNPWLAWLPGAAEAVRAQRQALDDDALPRRAERAGAEVVSATLDLYRALRDAASEAMFFQTFGAMFALTMADEDRAEAAREAAERRAGDDERLRRLLATIGQGGYAAAAAR